MTSMRKKKKEPLIYTHCKLQGPGNLACKGSCISSLYPQNKYFLHIFRLCGRKPDCGVGCGRQISAHLCGFCLVPALVSTKKLSLHATFKEELPSLILFISAEQAPCFLTSAIQQFPAQEMPHCFSSPSGKPGDPTQRSPAPRTGEVQAKPTHQHPPSQ